MGFMARELADVEQSRGSSVYYRSLKQKGVNVMVQSMPCHHLYGFGILPSLGEMRSIIRRLENFLVITML